MIAIDGGFGNDIIDASKVPAGKAAVQLSGGVGNDVLYGTEGGDLVDGGSGTTSFSCTAAMTARCGRFWRATMSSKATPAPTR